MKAYDRLFIGGEWVSPSGTGTIDVINPTTEEVVGRVPDATEADVDKAVAAAREAFDNGPWPRMAPAERADILTKVSAGHPGRHAGDSPSSSPPRWDHRCLGHDGPGLRPHHDPRLLRRARLDVRSSTRSARASWARCSWPRSRSVWSAPSAPGTCRCSSPRPSSPRPWSRAARSSSSPPPRPRSTPSVWPRCSRRRACPRVC